MAAEKVIVSCAITGSIHVPSQSPHLPVTADEIATSAIEAAEAGAAILHLHARDPETGQPSSDPEHFVPFLSRIADATPAVINITTGGASTMTIEERLAGPLRFSPELASLNLGTMNFALFHMAGAPGLQPWEEEYYEGSRSRVFRNTFADIEAIVERLGAGGTRFEFECYDVGHLHTLAHFVDRGIVKPPFFVQVVLGILGGIAPTVDHLVHLRATADKLFGDDLVFSVLGAGRHQMPLAVTNAVMGANLRVGLEDSLYLRRGRLAVSNAEQVAKIVRILDELSLEVASPDEARARLGLKGAAATNLALV